MAKVKLQKTYLKRNYSEYPRRRIGKLRTTVGLSLYLPKRTCNVSAPSSIQNVLSM